MASSRTFWGRMDSLRTYWNRGMARRAISGLYFNTDIGPVPTPPGPELTSSKMLRRSSRTRSRVTRGIRAIMFSLRIGPEEVSRRVSDHGCLLEQGYALRGCEAGRRLLSRIYVLQARS